MEKKEDLRSGLDFTCVDTYPMFESCKNFEEPEKRTCFKEEIRKRIATSLTEIDFTVEDEIEETIIVHLMIYKTGKIKLKTIQSSEEIHDILPSLDSLLRVSVKKLPKIQPAMKKGFLVTTKYKLPIKISLDND
ncbi:hypothetical protein [Tenacibaculum sp. MAR_2009_124]|uniref:hypothetical protein n=1 Tax=Tenacibaculum sp. MAR_2009_124 TaxID=1250059 RepID=UPI000B8585D2|nr:hypothetical protein [Tenacibaculum sp. MAR_2009_124]